MTLCPRCGIRLTSEGVDITIDEQPRPPKVGDAALCGHCGAVALLDRDGRWRLLPPEYYAMLPLHTRAAIERIKKQREQ